MGLMAKDSGGSDFEKAPEGMHVARCYELIDLGMQERNFNNEVKHKHIVRVGWELPNEKMADGQPFTIAQMYTLSLSEKSNLRRDLQSWRGKQFTPEELDGFELSKLLGVPCQVNVIHNLAPNGNTYANVQSINPLIKGLACPPAVNPISKFFLDDDFDEVAFNGLSDYLREKINFPQGSQVPPAIQAAQAPHAAQAARTPPPQPHQVYAPQAPAPGYVSGQPSAPPVAAGDFPDDDIPF